MENNKFTDLVAACIDRHHLFEKQDLILVALSGGADSVALACALIGLGYKIEAAHCHFGLRGEESDRDENFVRQFCDKRHIPLHVTRFATSLYARQHGISVEMAARDLRYTYFRDLKKERGAACIAVAHHSEDDVETLLLNMIRGTGIRGLRGIVYRHEDVVRPLLDVSRKQIEDYLTAIHQNYVTDSTNLEDEVQRNKIRLNIMPLIRELNPAADRNLHALTRKMDEAVRLYDSAVASWRLKVQDASGRILISQLKASPAPSTLLYEILREADFSSSLCEDIYQQLDGEPGKIYESPTHRLLRDRDCLILRSREQKIDLKHVVVPLEGVMTVTDRLSFRITRYAYVPDRPVPKDKNTVCLDLDRLQFPIVVRQARPGDRFVPFGMKGQKLLSDFLTDLKKNAFEKEDQLVLCSGDEIAWVIGERPDNRFRIEDTTRHVLQIQIIP